jgi:hypothetical protein
MFNAHSNEHIITNKIMAKLLSSKQKKEFFMGLAVVIKFMKTNGCIEILKLIKCFNLKKRMITVWNITTWQTSEAKKLI